MYKPRFTITDEILADISRIEELRSLAKHYRILPEREAFVRRRATVESTHSSTSIEGNPLNIKQVERTLSSRKRLTKNQYAEIEVKNYQKALQWIAKRKQSSHALEIQDILTLHGIITQSLLDDTRSGKFRRYPVYIENQNGDTVYNGPDAKIVKRELTDFLDWLNNPSNQIHHVLAAGILHYALVSIHPFADGNGRTARATVSLYLSLVDYDFRESLVLDSYYAVDRKAYYDALKVAQGGDYNSAIIADLTSWLSYFTKGFLSSTEILSIELQSLAVLQGNNVTKRLSREESDILDYAIQFGSVSLSEVLEMFPDLSRRTLQRKLNALTESGYLQSVDKGPATKYVIKNN